MLVIRLQRIGRTHLPVYRMVVQDSRRHPLSGNVVAEVGSYDPKTKKTVLDKEKIDKYLSNGAQPSPRVAKILNDNKVKLPSWVVFAAKKSAKAKHPDKLHKNQPKAEVEEPVAEVKTDETAA